MNRERTKYLEEKYMAEHPGTAGTVEPYVFDARTKAALKRAGQNFTFPAPVITDLMLSDDWEETDQEWFVDSSGFGQKSEPALTINDFRDRLVEYLQRHPDHGFGLSGVGQFQVYVRAYQRVQ